MVKINNILKDVIHILGVWLPARIKYSDTPGLSIVISHKGKILYKDGFGYADVEKKIKTKEDSIYHIASISKTFTTVAILQLVEKNKLKLNDEVSKYLKWFKGKNKTGRLEDITIKQLLSNTSGIWRDGDTSHWVTGKFPKSLKSLPTDTLIFKPSSEFKYSNFGFSILGEVIKSASGLIYEKYVQENILDVLNLKHTYPDYKNGIKGVATGYGKAITGQKREKFGHHKTNSYMSATGFLSDAIDLAKYTYNLFPKSGHLILKNNSKKEMMRPRVKTDGKDKYCLGLEERKINGRKIYGHGGGFQGFCTNTVFDPISEIGVVILTNSIQAPVDLFTTSLLQTVYNLLDENKKYSLNKNTNLDKYEGVYRNLWGDSVVVRAGNALVTFGLYTHSPLQGDNKRFLVPIGKDKFIVKGGSGFHSKGETVKFSGSKKGKFQTVFFGPTPSKRIV